MSRVEPQPVHRSWPVFEPSRQLEFGSVFDAPALELAEIAVREALGRKSAGWWECELPANELTWTAGVYDIFGLPQQAGVTRDEAVVLYCEPSRARMERLRSFSIIHGRGFALDAQIRPADGSPTRWMRLLGAPVCEDGQTVRIHGLKLIL